MGSSLALDQKFLCMLFRLCETFFANVSKGYPFNFFIFCNRIDVQKVPKGPPFTFFGTMRLTGDSKKSENFFPHSGTVEENT